MCANMIEVLRSQSLAQTSTSPHTPKATESSTQESLLADPMLGQIESDLIDIDAVLADLDDLEALGYRISAAQADGSIVHRVVLAACAQKMDNTTAADQPQVSDGQ